MAQLPSDGATLRKCLRLRLQVRYMEHSSLQHAAPADRAAHGGRHVTYRRQNWAVVGDGPQPIVDKAEDGYVISVAEPPGALDQRVKHRLQVEGRTADDL